MKSDKTKRYILCKATKHGNNVFGIDIQNRIGRTDQYKCFYNQLIPGLVGKYVTWTYASIIAEGDTIEEVMNSSNMFLELL